MAIDSLYFLPLVLRLKEPSESSQVTVIKPTLYVR